MSRSFLGPGVMVWCFVLLTMSSMSMIQAQEQNCPLPSTNDVPPECQHYMWNTTTCTFQCLNHCVDNLGSVVPVNSSYKWGCNWCTCGIPYSICTRMGCGPRGCYDEKGQPYDLGQTIIRGCRTATCTYHDENGRATWKWDDTQRTIDKQQTEDKPLCVSNLGFVVPLNSSFFDLCNSCACRLPAPYCTVVGCLTGACYDDQAKTYNQGQTITRGCRTATCTYDDRSGKATWKWDDTQCTNHKQQTENKTHCMSNLGDVVPVGRRYFNECNSCTCRIPSSSCTRMGCRSRACYDDQGRPYNQGQIMKRGCQTATCTYHDRSGSGTPTWKWKWDDTQCTNTQAAYHNDQQ